MRQLTANPPYSAVEPVTEVLHGVPITDPYRWLEYQESQRTRDWIAAQTEYTRSYLDAIPGREHIRERIRELLDIETYDSIQRVGERYIFRKRTCGQEQPSIFLRESFRGVDQLLIDPAERGTGNHTAIRPLQLSQDGRLLLYEVKEGGERTGAFELLNIDKREKLPDALPRGYLRGFAFAQDGKSFYYVHEAPNTADLERPKVYHHLLGTSTDVDSMTFCAPGNERLRLHILAGGKRLGFLVYRFSARTYLDFYVWSCDEKNADLLVKGVDYRFEPLLLKDRILAITSRNAPNSKIIEVCTKAGLPPEFVDVVSESDSPIRGWAVTSDSICVSYVRGAKHMVHVFDLQGKQLVDLSIEGDDTIRLVGASAEDSDLLIERESFTTPVQVYRYSPRTGDSKSWAQKVVPFEPQAYTYVQAWFRAKDSTRIPIFLAGMRDVLAGGSRPTIMTSYGGFGVSMTPQFSVFVAFLMERGCLFAVPNIRGGAEFGLGWHNAGKRQKRQSAIDDFVAAAEWLIEQKRTKAEQLAIFGGSNSGLLVGAALTQRPDLFRATVCMVPILDMLRYHLFDNAHVWVDEFGTADDLADFASLLGYSPYHRVREGIAYPATMIVSGDADQNCNPLHARKMTARLQAANVSDRPIVLDYSKFRGHSPVLPLSERVEALTDRMSFLCDQLGLRC